MRRIGAARDWTASELCVTYAAASKSRMNVTVPSYVQGAAPRVSNDTMISNVVMTLAGSSGSNRAHVISERYDLCISDVLNILEDAPGSNHDASSVIVVMELSWTMAVATHSLEAMIVLAAVAGEEQGLLGSNFLVTQMRAAGIGMQGMRNNDIVGSSIGDNGTSAPFDIRMFAQGIPCTETAVQMAMRVSIGGENDC